MALVKCRECGSEVSSEALACPKCGVRPKPKTSVLKVVFWLFIASIALPMFFAGSKSSSTTAPPKEVTKEEVARAAENAAENRRFKAAMHMLRQVKASMRDPESFRVERFAANDDGSLLCLQYRSRNGFGGMNREQMVIDNGNANRAKEAWKKRCTSALYDTGISGEL